MRKRKLQFEIASVPPQHNWRFQPKKQPAKSAIMADRTTGRSNIEAALEQLRQGAQPVHEEDVARLRRSSTTISTCCDAIRSQSLKPSSPASCAHCIIKSQSRSTGDRRAQTKRSKTDPVARIVATGCSLSPPPGVTRPATRPPLLVEFGRSRTRSWRV